MLVIIHSYVWNCAEFLSVESFKYVIFTEDSLEIWRYSVINAPFPPIWYPTNNFRRLLEMYEED